jgi:hypothetical protein
MRITKAEAVTGLREQGRGIAGSIAWLRIGKAVVIGQLALSLPLLVGAGLLVRTLVNLERVDLGYSKDNLLTLRVDANAAGYDPTRQALAFETLLERIRAIPGVRSATFSNNGLFGGSDNGDQINVEGYTPKGDNDTGSRYDQIGPGYFSTLGVPILLGREITADDRPGGRGVCVINETFAKHFFAGRHPIGLHVTQVYAEQRHTYEVVGVVRDSRQNRLRGEIEHRLYAPATQPAASIEAVTYLIRPRGDGSAVLADARRIVQRTEPKMSMSRVGPLTEAIDSRLVQDRLLARISIGFGVVASLLAAMGPLRRAVVRRGASHQRDRHPEGARRAARHVDGDDPARDGLAPGGRAGRRWRALGGGDPADHEPALRALARRSDHFRDRRHRPGAGGTHRHVAPGLARLASGSAGRASLRVGTGSGYISLSDIWDCPLLKTRGTVPTKEGRK